VWASSSSSRPYRAPRKCAAGLDRLGCLVDRIVNLLKEDSILRCEIDCDAFRTQVERIAKPYNLETESERLEAFCRMFELLEGCCDVHSGLVLPGVVEENQAAWADGRTPHTPGEDLENPYGANAGCSREGLRASRFPATSRPGSPV